MATRPSHYQGKCSSRFPSMTGLSNMHRYSTVDHTMIAAFHLQNPLTSTEIWADEKLSVFSILSHNLCTPGLWQRVSGADVAQRLCNGQLRDDPGFDYRWENCKNQGSRPTQEKANGGAVSKWPRCRWDAKHN